MNKVYKVIFNRNTGLEEVVSELAGGHTKSLSVGRRSTLRRFIVACLFASTLVFVPAVGGGVELPL